jgi:uncharacterized protein (TIGR02001 family)
MNSNASTTWARIFIIPSSKTANKPTGPAPIITTSVSNFSSILHILQKILTNANALYLLASMKIKLLLAAMLLPATAKAQALPTVEVNMGVLNQFRQEPTQYIQPQEEFELAMRPPAPRYETAPYYPPAAPEIEAEQEKLFDINGEFSGNVAFVSDYAFRGISQTREAPAVQGGFDFEHGSGAYVGLWASSLEFGDGEAGTEVDYYAGYSQDLGAGFSVDGGVLYYSYPGANQALNYDFVEVYGGIGYETALVGQDVSGSTTLNYSPDYFAQSGNSYYLKTAASTPLPHGFTLDGTVGYQWVEDNDAFLLPDYADWSLGLAYELEGFELKAQYVDTSISSDDCADGCDTKGILSVSRAL